MKSKSLNVLVVDDSRASRMVIRKFMHDFGFALTEAEDGTAGLNRLKGKSKFDLILVDWDMPGISGVEFIRQARENEAYAKTPIIMVSTQDTRDPILKAIEAGASEYIMKPFTREAFETKLDILGIEYK